MLELVRAKAGDAATIKYAQQHNVVIATEDQRRRLKEAGASDYLVESLGKPRSPDKIPGFTFSRHETFECGGQKCRVDIHKCDAFARVLDLAGTQSQPACEFAMLPSSRCVMGNEASGPKAIPDETPAREVEIDAFPIARTELTKQIWDGLLPEELKERIPEGVLRVDIENAEYRKRPVTDVSWSPARLFCRSSGLRLPSEAEWEYACRAGVAASYYFGNEPNDLDQYAWVFKNTTNNYQPQICNSQSFFAGFSRGPAGRFSAR